MEIIPVKRVQPKILKIMYYPGPVQVSTRACKIYEIGIWILVRQNLYTTKIQKSLYAKYISKLMLVLINHIDKVRSRTKISSISK